ncbi:MAG: hypothetical protein OEX81_01690 [Candidatus Pacebacteria bacterium]|nr:hypothetical protein [Candidatus Paceibacterota bacterium]
MQPLIPKKKKFFFIPKVIKTPFLLIYLSTLVSALVTLVFYFGTQPVIPIFYSLPEAAQHLAAKEWLFIFPGFSFLISIFHTGLIKPIMKSDKLLLLLFAWTTVVIQVVLLLALIRIVYIIS